MARSRRARMREQRMQERPENPEPEPEASESTEAAAEGPAPAEEDVVGGDMPDDQGEFAASVDDGFDMDPAPPAGAMDELEIDIDVETDPAAGGVDELDDFADDFPEAESADDGPAAEPETEPAAGVARGSARRGSRRSSRRGGDDDAGDDPESPSASGRRSGRRGSRASQRKSARDEAVKARGGRSKKKRQKKDADPEAAAERKKSMLTLVAVLSAILLLSAGGYAAWYFLLRAESVVHELPGDEEAGLPPQEVEWTRQQLARWYLREAQDYYSQAHLAKDKGKYTKARTLVRKCRERLTVPFLNQAEANPSPENEAIGSVEQAERAHELMVKLSDLEEEITEVEERVRAEANYKRVLNAFDNLSDERTDLAELRSMAEAFIANPVDPTSAADQTLQQRFSSMTDYVQTRLATIDQEAARREHMRTTGVVNKARTDINNYIKDQMFGKALSHIDTLQVQWPDADLESLRQSILQAAREDFDSQMEQARNAFDRAKAPSSTEADRRNAYREGMAALDAILDNYNRDVPNPAPEFQRYIDQAEALKREYAN